MIEMDEQYLAYRGGQQFASNVTFACLEPFEWQSNKKK